MAEVTSDIVSLSSTLIKYLPADGCVYFALRSLTIAVILHDLMNSHSGSVLKRAGILLVRAVLLNVPGSRI